MRRREPGLRGGEMLGRARALVRPEDFGSYPHRLVYLTALALADAGHHVSSESVYLHLRETGRATDLGKKPAAYLADLYDADPTGASLNYAAGLVREATDNRALRAVALELVRDVDARVEPAADLAARFARQAAELGGGKRTDPRFRFMTAAEFDAGDYRPEWLVKHVLVRGEPAVGAGPPKALKTLLGLDLFISLAGGRAFLGQFEVPRRVRVAVVSGASGKSTLQAAAQRIAASKGLGHADLGEWLHWCFEMPVLSDLAGMAEFADELVRRGVEVVMLDPLYLAMADVDMRNMFEAGPALRNVARMLLDRGITPVLLHHSNRQATANEPLQLSNIAFAGVDQFCRQYLLVSRRERYEGDGIHKLWVSVGGSAFSGRLWVVDVDEGMTDDQFQGRKWEVTVSTADDLRAGRAAERESEKERAARQRMQAEETQVLDAVDAETAAGRPGATVTWIPASGTRTCPQRRPRTPRTG